MRVRNIVRLLCRPCLELVHATRLTTVLAAVEAIVCARRLSVTSVGRAVAGRTFPKHGIKRIDRLLSNPRMWLDRFKYFRGLASVVIGSCPRPVVLIDWTKCVGGQHALAAAVPVGGRAVPIYIEVHPEARLYHHLVHRAFLRALQRILPEGCQPILVSDAGFQGPFFREVLALGWDYIGRVRGLAKARFEDRRWVTVFELYDRATTTPTSLGPARLYKCSKRLHTTLVLIRARRRQTPHPWQHQWGHENGIPSSTITACKDPWLLATSLDAEPARITSIYSKRMQIEETFRDAKNHRFGWSLRFVRSRDTQRLEVLLLLMVLAMAAVTLLGAAATRDQRHRRYQANTVRHRVFADFTLGVEILKRSDTVGLTPFLRQALSSWRAVLLECTR